VIRAARAAFRLLGLVAASIILTPRGEPRATQRTLPAVAPEAAAMSAGDIVVYLTDPLLYGRLLIIQITPDGRLLCEALHADRDGDLYRGIFDAHEVDLASRFLTAASH
jgi:hypothetical protein